MGYDIVNVAIASYTDRDLDKDIRGNIGEKNRGRW